MTQQATDEEDPSTSNRKRGVAWEWAISVNPATQRVKCKLCGHEMTGISRFKDHLLRIPGDVRPCPATTPEIMNKVAESKKLKIQKKADKKTIHKFFGDLEQIDDELVELDGGNVVSDVRAPLDLLIRSDPAKEKQKTIQELHPAKKQLKLEAWDAIGAWQTVQKRNRDCEGAATEIRDSKLNNRSLDVTGIQPAASDDTPGIQGGGSANVGAKRGNVERRKWSGGLDFTDLLTENPSLITSNEMKNKEEMEKKKLPTNEQFCCLTNGLGWRCKKFRMTYGAAADDTSVPKTKFCEKHYNYFSSYYKNYYYKKKKTSGDGQGAVCSTATGPVEEANCSKLGEKLTEEDGDADIQKLGATGHNISDRIGRKMENVERAEESGEPESFKGNGEPVVELESLEHYKTKCFELSAMLEKKKFECTTLQGKLLGVVETKKTFEDAAEYWRKMYSDLESRVLREENENSTMRSFFTKLDGLLPRHGKESSLLRCKELRNSEETESEAWGTQNEVIHSGEKHNRCNHNAETRSGGRKGPYVFELKTKENVHAFGNNEHHESESEFHNYSAGNISSGSLRLSSGGEKVAEGKCWGCSEKRPAQQHGSSSGDHLEMSTEPFVNLVSDDDSVESLGESEDSDYSTDSEGSLHLKYRNTKEEKEMKWKFEADMLSSLEDDPELCMKAVCALYRKQISEGKGLLHNSDALRCTTLVKLLMDEDCKGDLNKSVEDLEILDSNAIDDCKRLARRYSTPLFGIYQSGKDHFYLPSTTASNGDETAK